MMFVYSRQMLFVIYVEITLFLLIWNLTRQSFFQIWQKCAPIRQKCRPLDKLVITPFFVKLRAAIAQFLIHQELKFARSNLTRYVVIYAQR